MAGHQHHHHHQHHEHQGRAHPVPQTVEERDVDPEDILSYAYVLRHRIMHHQAKQGIVHPLLSKQRTAAQKQQPRTCSASAMTKKATAPSPSTAASRSVDFTPSISIGSQNGSGAIAPWQSLNDLSCLAAPLGPPPKQLTARARKQPGPCGAGSLAGYSSRASGTSTSSNSSSNNSSSRTYSVTTVPVGGRRRQQHGRGGRGGRNGPGAVGRRRRSLTASLHLSPQGTPRASRRCSLPAILEQDSDSEEERATTHSRASAMAAMAVLAEEGDAAVTTATTSRATTPLSAASGSSTPMPMRAAHTDDGEGEKAKGEADEEGDDETFGFGPAFGFGELASRLDQVACEREEQEEEEQGATSAVPCLALPQGESSLPHLTKQPEWQAEGPRYRQTTAKPRALGSGPLFGGPVPRSPSKRRSRHVRHRSWPSEPSALPGTSASSFSKASHLASPSLASIPLAEEDEEEEEEEEAEEVVESKQDVQQQQQQRQRQREEESLYKDKAEETRQKEGQVTPFKESQPVPTPPSTSASNKAGRLTRWRRFSNLAAVPLSPCYEASEEFTLPRASSPTSNGGAADQ